MPEMPDNIPEWFHNEFRARYDAGKKPTGNESAKGVPTVDTTTLLRIIQGGITSPNWPANVDGLVGEVADELRRLANASVPSTK
jgi:hypothetical protein